MAETLDRIERSSLLVHLRPVLELDDAQFEEFCRINRDLHIEMTAEGDLSYDADYGRPGIAIRNQGQFIRVAHGTGSVRLSTAHFTEWGKRARVAGSELYGNTPSEQKISSAALP